MHADSCRALAIAALLAVATPALAHDDDDDDDDDGLRIVRSSISCQRYDGVSDDLLTAGLGKTGLQSTAPPLVATPPANPSAPQLRRLAIYNNYRALADMTPNGGYGRLYGPNIDLAGNDTLVEGKIAGKECLAYADDGTGRKNVTMMVQIPDSFDPRNACIVAAPSSGSRGVYGAIGTTGEWGLKRGCAVAYTDKGTGNGAHDLQNNTVNLIDGLRADAGAVGKASNFTARLSAARRAAFNAASPNRVAYKHAHSEQNPEKDWGEHVLVSIEFAFQILNERFGHKDDDDDDRGRRITKRNTIVIAASVSNGGGASLAAAEQDKRRLIDGIVVSEPQVQPRFNPHLTIKRGDKVIANHSKSLYDYITLANLFQPCAALANAGAPGGFLVNVQRATNRCDALHKAGLLGASTLPEQASEAQTILNDSGWEPESNILGPSHYGLQVAPAVAVTYANAHGRFRVLNNLCGFSMGGVGADGNPAAPAPAVLAQIFGIGNGVPPTGGGGGILLINNNSVPGLFSDPVSVSPSTGLQDFNFDGARCLRRLFTGPGADALRVRFGIAQVKRSGNLREKPAIIVHGRADNLVPVNHSSRPYFGLNRMVEGRDSNLRYYEVTNAQHFEAFIGIQPLLAGYDTRFIPLHVYGIQALN
ncbi:MAG: 3-hydroxybutyrate oligomer hydrolase family protein, partial [Gammaproteobacteria bacterium]